MQPKIVTKKKKKANEILYLNKVQISTSWTNQQ